MNQGSPSLVGDLATENDALRLARSQTPVRQITTGTLCHLEAATVQNALEEEQWDLNHLDFLFIENVGNLVCPSSYDLGEDLRLVLISVTEGEDKPLKYPTIFNSADVAVVTSLTWRQLSNSIRPQPVTISRPCAQACPSLNSLPRREREWKTIWNFSLPACASCAPHR
jgi:hydrogenase accessory protein HypB